MSVVPAVPATWEAEVEGLSKPSSRLTWVKPAMMRPHLTHKKEREKKRQKKERKEEEIRSEQASVKNQPVVSMY